MQVAWQFMTDCFECKESADERPEIIALACLYLGQEMISLGTANTNTVLLPRDSLLNCCQQFGVSEDKVKCAASWICNNTWRHSTNGSSDHS